MDRQRIIQYKTEFDKILRYITDEDGEQIEVCYARELQTLLGYTDWEDFNTVIRKAMVSCEAQGSIANDHFRIHTETDDLFNGEKREVPDYTLTRYACYLTAQNGDPKKKEIAFAQSYFAFQTRKAELIEERLNLLHRLETRERLKVTEKQFSDTLYDRGIDDKGFGRIRSKGDNVLFGGYNTKNMKKRLGIRDNRPLADFLPTLTIVAKNLAMEITNHNTQEKDLNGEDLITEEHLQNNQIVREGLEKRGIKPENLPVADDIKKLERRVARDKKIIEKTTSKLPKQKNGKKTGN